MARFSARRLRRPKANDSLETSEVDASMRKDGLVGDGEGRGGYGGESPAATVGHDALDQRARNTIGIITMGFR